MSRLVCSIIALAMAVARPVGAQQGPHLVVMLPPGTRVAVEGPRVGSVGVVGTSRLEEYITSGFPARLNYKIELWSRRQTFDNPVGPPVTWTVIVTYDQLKREFTILREMAGSRTHQGPYKDFADVETAVAGAVEAPIRAPMTNQRMYYTVELRIVKVDVKDLDELKQWWGIEVRPAAQGKRSFFGALMSGAQKIALRVLGGADPFYRAESETFTPRS